MTKVSFIVAAYNIDIYIERCLNTLLNQTLQEIEIVVVNDGSTDSTLKRINELAKNNEKIKVINQENKGLLEARKSGINNSIGEYVVFVDGDDWVESCLAEKAYNLAKLKNSDIIVFNSKSIDDNNNTYVLEDYTKIDFENKDFLRMILQEKLIHNVWNKLIKREFIPIDKFNLLPSITMGEDFVINTLLAIEKPKYEILDECLYFYYKRSNSIMNEVNEKYLQIENTIDYMEKMLKDNNIYQDYKDEIECLWFWHCYMMGVIFSTKKLNFINRSLYTLWKNKNIDLKNNSVVKFRMSKHIIYYNIMKWIFDRNYLLGEILINIKVKITNFIGKGIYRR